MKTDLKNAGILLVALAATGFVAGCGAGKQSVEVASKQDVASMETLRKAYDSVGGDYSKLSAEQKKQFLDFTKGNQAAVDSMWKTMSVAVGVPSGTPNTAEEARKKQMRGGPGG